MYIAKKMIIRLRFCVADSVKEVRVAGYRALRYLIADVTTLEQIVKLNYEIFFMRCVRITNRQLNRCLL